MSKVKLTEKQETFLEALFDEKTGGKLRDAARIAGYSDKTKLCFIYEPLKEQIIEKAHKRLAATAPEAVAKLISVMRDPAQVGGPIAISAVREIFDRGGVVREEKVSHSLEGNAMFILPAKNPVEKPEEE